MQMGAGCAAGMSDQADDLSLFYDFSGFYFSFFQMGINRLQPLTVVDDDHVAGVKIVFAAQNDFAAARGLDRRSFRRGNVGAAVGAFRRAVENPLIAEFAADAAFYRQDETFAPVVPRLKSGGRLFVRVGFPRRVRNRG